MASPSNTDSDIDSIAILQAEMAARSSLERFEAALAELNLRVRESSEKIHQAIDLAAMPKRKIMDLTERVRQNPEPYLLAAFGIVATLLLVRRVLFAVEARIAEPKTNYVPTEAYPNIPEGPRTRNGHALGYERY